MFCGAAGCCEVATAPSTGDGAADDAETGEGFRLRFAVGAVLLDTK